MLMILAFLTSHKIIIPMNKLVSKHENFPSVQILRALAALLVVIWHSHLAIKIFANNYWTSDIAGHGQSASIIGFFPLHYLYIGVDIFFVISGFIMAMLIERAPPPITVGKTS